MIDEDDKRYIDGLAGLAVTSLGHAHPEVADAINTQAHTLLHTSNLYGTKPALDVAATLDRLIRGGGAGEGKVFFCNSGAEANECAIKLARKNGGRGKHVVVSAYGSFHGRTLTTLHATGQPQKHEAFQPLPEGFRHVAWRRCRRPRGGARSIGCRNSPRAGPGRRRREPSHHRVLRRSASTLR